jgi:hypothetical protein
MHACNRPKCSISIKTSLGNGLPIAFFAFYSECDLQLKFERMRKTLGWSLTARIAWVIRPGQPDWDETRPAPATQRTFPYVWLVGPGDPNLFPMGNIPFIASDTGRNISVREH